MHFELKLINLYYKQDQNAEPNSIGQKCDKLIYRHCIFYCSLPINN